MSSAFIPGQVFTYLEWWSDPKKLELDFSTRHALIYGAWLNEWIGGKPDVEAIYCTVFIVAEVDQQIEQYYLLF